MELYRHLKRARAKTREPFTRTAFAVVSALVREFNLDEGFLAGLRSFSLPGAEWLDSLEPIAKSPFEAPLFSLTSEAEYRLAQAILASTDNPYLRFARSPEELLLAGPLFRLNSGLEPGTLARVHFRTLLAREIVQQEITGMKRLPEAEANPPVTLLRRESLLHRLETVIHNAKIGNHV